MKRKAHSAISYFFSANCFLGHHLFSFHTKIHKCSHPQNSKLRESSFQDILTSSLMLLLTSAINLSGTAAPLLCNWTDILLSISARYVVWLCIIWVSVKGFSERKPHVHNWEIFCFNKTLSEVQASQYQRFLSISETLLGLCLVFVPWLELFSASFRCSITNFIAMDRSVILHLDILYFTSVVCSQSYSVWKWHIWFTWHSLLQQGKTERNVRQSTSWWQRQ